MHMIKVITYGTFDLLHYGHVKLLERAKELGDYLIVGITADDFDVQRGKINVQQSLVERLENVRKTGLADQIIVEEYEGQKIDDIKKYDVDIFTVGSDWEGTFDYLNEYCQVVYLARTKGVSSSELRDEDRKLNMGMIGFFPFLNKVERECEYVDGVEISSVCTENINVMSESVQRLPFVTNNYSLMLENVDAVYIHSHPNNHYFEVKEALNKGKHVICEAPLALSALQCEELFILADKKNCVLMEALRTAYANAYSRLLLLVKGGIIGEVVSVEATCTSLTVGQVEDDILADRMWNSITAWGPTALLPVFQILGTQYKEKRIATHFLDETRQNDTFSKIDFVYDNAVASLKVGNRVKSEGDLIISGTKGYIYVPAPWWKTDYFEVRFENPAENKRYFYQLDGEGIRNELVAFTRTIKSGRDCSNINKEVTVAIAKIMEDFIKNIDVIEI